MRSLLLVSLVLLAACSPVGDPADSGTPRAGPGNGTLPPANPAVASIGGCQVFPADNAWNRDVSGDPVDPASDALLAQMSPDNELHLDLGTTEQYYGIPFSVVPENQPLVPITYGTDGANYSDESDPGPMPIPLDAPIEGGSSADPNPTSGDRHLLVIQQGSCILYELYNTVRTASGLRVSASAEWDLKIDATRPPGWTSADAAGLPILPGLLKYDEVGGNHLTHALRFTVPHARRGYTPPANHCGQYADASLPPYGIRVRLKAGFDLSPYTGDARTILTALKKYGLVFADQGSAWYVTGTSDPRWEDALSQLRTHKVYGRDFEVLRIEAVTSC